MLRKTLLLLLCLGSLSGRMMSGVPRGYVQDDPCIRCGEDFEFYPNETSAAIREAERIGFDWRTAK